MWITEPLENDRNYDWQVSLTSLMPSHRHLCVLSKSYACRGCTFSTSAHIMNKESTKYAQDVTTLMSKEEFDGLPEARRREFLDEFERDLPADDAPPRTAPAEDATSSAKVDVDWERRVQFDALRDGNALKQNDVLQRAIQRDA